MMKFKGKDLDEAIEDELQIMLLQGFDTSPISPKSLHTRLKQKGIVSGGLSTLSTARRKTIIQAYIERQLAPLNLNTKEKQQYVNRKTRSALVAKNKQLQAEVSALKKEMLDNTAAVIEIVKAVKLNTAIPVESLLSEYLIRELRKE
jgi:hypothetical protein